MFWKDGKKLFVYENNGQFEITDDLENIVFPVSGFVIKTERDPTLQKHIYDHETQNLRKQFLPYYVLNAHIFFTEDIYFQCPINCGKVIVQNITYKDYAEFEFEIEICCILILPNGSIKKQFQFKKTPSKGVFKTFSSLINNLNILINNNISLEENILFEDKILSDEKTTKNLFEVINKLTVYFKHFTTIKIGRDDSERLKAYIIPDKHVNSNYVNNLIKNKILNNRLIGDIDELSFYPSRQDLLENVSEAGENSGLNRDSPLYKEKELEYILKDALKLNLLGEYNTTLDLISEITSVK
jgi:hypothetical protein